MHVMYMSGIYLAEPDDGPHHVHGHQAQVLHVYVNVCYSEIEDRKFNEVIVS